MNSPTFPEIGAAKRLGAKRRRPAHNKIRLLHHDRFHIQILHTLIGNLLIGFPILRPEIFAARKPHGRHDVIPHTKREQRLDGILPYTDHSLRRLRKHLRHHLSIAILRFYRNRIIPVLLLDSRRSCMPGPFPHHRTAASR